MNTKRGSIGGVTIGDGWLRNNPDLTYPDGHEFMTDAELKCALKKGCNSLGIVEARMPTAAEVRIARSSQPDCGILPINRRIFDTPCDPKPRHKGNEHE